MRLVSSSPEFFAHDGLMPAERGEGFGCHCAKCEREISAPFEMQGELIWCLYCGMNYGFVPLIEKPFVGKYTFGKTLEECREESEWLECGIEHFEKMAEERDRRLGRIIDLFGSFDYEH